MKEEASGKPNVFDYNSERSKKTADNLHISNHNQSGNPPQGPVPIAE